MRFILFLFTIWAFYLLFRWIILPLFLFIAAYLQNEGKRPSKPKYDKTVNNDFSDSDVQDAEFEEMD